MKTWQTKQKNNGGNENTLRLHVMPCILFPPFSHTESNNVWLRGSLSRLTFLWTSSFSKRDRAVVVDGEGFVVEGMEEVAISVVEEAHRRRRRIKENVARPARLPILVSVKPLI